MIGAGWPTRLAPAAWLLLALPWSGCDPVPAGGRDQDRAGIVVTQTPARDDRPTPPDRLSPAARYPSGSRVVLVPAGGEPGEPRVLSGKLAAAGAPDVSPAADLVLFAGQRTPSSSWAIFEARVRGSRPRPVVEIGRDCADPAYLADDRIVCACAGEAAGPGSEDTTTWSLYVAGRDGSGIERITFGPGSAFDPSPLEDGRILFSRWQGPGVGRSTRGETALFTVNPDGTLLEAFTGSHEPPALKARARQTPDGGVVFLAAERDGTAPRLERVEMSRPLATRRILPLALPWASGGGSSPASLHPGAAEPLPEAGLLIAGYPPARGQADRPTWAIFRLSPAGQVVEPVFDSPDWHEVEAIPLLPTAAPRGRPSALDRRLETGFLLCYDSRRSDGLVGPPATSPEPATVLVQTLGATSSARAGGSTLERSGGSGAASRSGTDLGEVPVENDASFFIEVPADRPIRLRSRDAAGLEIACSAWFWVRPGEVRACSGCHESRAAAPVNRPVLAISRAPRRPAPPGDPAR